MLLRAIDPFLRNLNPLLTGLGLYKNEVTALMGNVAAASKGVYLLPNGEQTHFLRAQGPFGPESLATYPNRLTTNRNNAYRSRWPRSDSPKAYSASTPASAALGITATLPTDTPNEPNFNARTENDVAKADRLLPAAEEIRLRRTGLLNDDPRPGLQPTGCLRADLRRRSSDHLPAHLRTRRMKEGV